MTTNTNNPEGKYASVNGISLYYEIHGTGKPLIMLHGGFGTFEMFAALSPALTEKYQVIGVDLYGHGRTASQIALSVLSTWLTISLASFSISDSKKPTSLASLLAVPWLSRPPFAIQNASTNSC